jgi:raffinose/stachyose/melibiose transport system substrate-binding protein
VFFSDAVDAWNKAHPDAQITVQLFASDAYKEKIRTSIGSGNAPTLIYSWAGGTLADYVAKGSVADITAQTPDLLKRVIPSVADTGKVNGKVYAVPNNQSQPIVLYYNKKLYDQVGVKVPTTWDELLTVVKAFNAKGIAPFSMAGQSKWPELMWIEYLTDRIGGPAAFKAVMDGKAGAWSDPAFAAALTKIQELVQAGGFAKGFASISADSNADLALVHTDKAAMVLQGSWCYSTFKSDAAKFVSDGNLGYMRFPTIAGGKGDPGDIVGNPSNYWSVSSSASAAQVQTATSFLNTLVLNDAYVGTMIKAGSVPPVAGLETQLAASSDAGFLTMAYGMVRDAPSFQLSWDQALSPAQAQALLTNLDQVFLGQAKPQQFVDNMNATIGK